MKRPDWNDLTNRQINKWFREHDESHLWPINGRFNAADRAIRRAQDFMRRAGYVCGQEYADLLDHLLSKIVNKEV